MADIQYSDKTVKDLFELLSQTSSTISKRNILVENNDNEVFKRYLNYLLNPFVITGISAKKIAKDTQKAPTNQFGTFDELMSYLMVNNTGTDEVIANIRSFLAAYDSEMSDFYISIIIKSARIGCDIKSVNKALDANFIPQWEVQQSYNIEKYAVEKINWFSLSQKLNGVRGTCFDGKIISRQGKEFNGLEHIINDIKELFEDFEEWVLDGELVRVNHDNVPDNENFRIGTGILSKDDANKKNIQFVVFDILPKNEFLAGESNLLYKDRLTALSCLKEKIVQSDLENVDIVEILYSGTDKSRIDYYLDLMIDEDKEGLMLNRDCKYYCKRHNGILKVKKFYTIDLRIIDIEEGTGRLAGKLGAFVVDYKGNKLNVGSGMTDEQRTDFWEHKDKLMDRIIEVKYKEESTDKKTENKSLQFPIFVSLRELGKEESYD